MVFGVAVVAAACGGGSAASRAEGSPNGAGAAPVLIAAQDERSASLAAAAPSLLQGTRGEPVVVLRALVYDDRRGGRILVALFHAALVAAPESDDGPNPEHGCVEIHIGRVSAPATGAPRLDAEEIVAPRACVVESDPPAEVSLGAADGATVRVHLGWDQPYYGDPEGPGRESVERWYDVEPFVRRPQSSH